MLRQPSRSVSAPTTINNAPTAPQSDLGPRMAGKDTAAAAGCDGQATIDAELCHGDDHPENRRLQPDFPGLRPQELRKRREHEELETVSALASTKVMSMPGTMMMPKTREKNSQSRAASGMGALRNDARFLPVCRVRACQQRRYACG